MRILITGASGFIGGHLFHNCPTDWDVRGTFFQTPRKIAPAGWLRLDLRNPQDTMRTLAAVRPDLILHTAAYSRTTFCEKNPEPARELNVEVVARLAQFCSDRKIRLIFLSSDMVFDGKKGSYSESDMPHPINVYGETKLAAERFVMELGDLGIVARLNLVYGKPKIGGDSFSEEVIRTVRSQRPYLLFTDQFRSYLSVKNLAQALREIIEIGFSGLIHLGGSESADRYSFALALSRRVPLDQSLLVPIKTAQRTDLSVAFPLRNTFNISKAEAVLKTRLLNLEEGLALEYPD
jgi:dTDP-4-dehydrorhamnose reductase